MRPATVTPARPRPAPVASPTRAAPEADPYTLWPPGTALPAEPASPASWPPRLPHTAQNPIPSAVAGSPTPHLPHTAQDPIPIAVAGSPTPRLPHTSQDLIPPATAASPAALQDGGPRGACLAAARRAEQVHGIPRGLLVAIALSESGLHAHALNIGGRAHFPDTLATARGLLSGAPAGASIMAGCVQVNMAAHARTRADWPLDAVRSADWGGGLLRRFHDSTGDWTQALRRWHGGSPAGSQRVICRVRAKLEVTAPGSTVLDGAGCDAALAARVRRSGAVLLEVAEAPGR